MHLQLAPVNLAPKFFFSALGGARAPSAPPGYTYDNEPSYSQLIGDADESFFFKRITTYDGRVLQSLLLDRTAIRNTAESDPLLCVTEPTFVTFDVVFYAK